MTTSLTQNGGGGAPAVRGRHSCRSSEVFAPTCATSAAIATATSSSKPPAPPPRGAAVQENIVPSRLAAIGKLEARKKTQPTTTRKNVPARRTGAGSGSQ